MVPSENAPSVLLLRDARMTTTAMYLERALARLSNLKSVYVNQYPDLLDALRLAPGRVRGSLYRTLLRRSLRLDRAADRFDLALVVEPTSLVLVPSEFAAATAYYAIDSHRNFRRHIREDRVAEYDVVFVAQKDFIPRYRSAGCRRVHWLPLAHDPAIHRKLDVPKRRNLVFVGNPWPGTERGRVVERMQASAGMEVHSAYLHDMARIQSEAKIVFNRSLSQDVNMRVFEALGCGSLLLTDRCENGFEELFQPGRDLVVYSSVEEAIELARQYLDAEEGRETIARQGHERALAAHTYDLRASEILRTAIGARAGSAL